MNFKYAWRVLTHNLTTSIEKINGKDIDVVKCSCGWQFKYHNIISDPKYGAGWTWIQSLSVRHLKGE